MFFPLKEKNIGERRPIVSFWEDLPAAREIRPRLVRDDQVRRANEPDRTGSRQSGSRFGGERFAKRAAGDVNACFERWFVMSVDWVRIIDGIHREKNIPREVLVEAIQSALTTAAKKHFPDAEDIQAVVDVESGKTSVTVDGKDVDPHEFGRIAAHTAKQVIIQKNREAERDSLFDEFEDQRGELMTGTVQRFEKGAVTVNIGKTEGLLPRGEQISGESHQPGERVRAIILDVRKVGQRVKIILSRTHPDFVRRLFELEIPEIQDQTISIRAISREAGHRSKVAVSSIDTKVDAVGACVGVRGTRIKNIVDELNGERIDIVRWNESLQVLIPNALQPAEIDEVLLCQLLGRAIVLVREDQLSLAIGRHGQNVRLASKLVGWDIEIMTSEELDEVIEKAVGAFMKIDGVDSDLANRLVEQGILSYDDLSVMEIADLVNTIEGLDEEFTEKMTKRAEELAEEQADEMPRRKGGRSAAAHAAHAAAAASHASNGESSTAAVDPSKGANPLTMARLFPDDEPTDSIAAVVSSDNEADGEDSESENRENENDGDDQESADTDSPRDLALAAEESGLPGSAREVTGPPSDEDQNETIRIATQAVEDGPRRSRVLKVEEPSEEPSVSRPEHATEPASSQPDDETEESKS